MKQQHLFSNDIFQAVQSANENQNLIISSFSIYIALLMTGNGSASVTRDEFNKVLKITDGDFSVANREMSSLMGDLQDAFKSKILSIANSLFVANDYSSKIKASFLSVMKNTFQSELKYVDYMNAPGTACQTINTWVEGKTNNKIKNLVPESAITKETKLILVNAIYFKGDWKYQFDQTLTSDLPFDLNDCERVHVPTMTLSNQQLEYGSDGRATWLHLPYSNEEFAMVIVLPNERFAISNLSDQVLSRSIDYLSVTKQKIVEVKLPKFKAEFSIELKKLLRDKLGMQTAFSDASADFSEITGSRDLVIDEVIHKAFVQVDEKGTEAAAATAVVMRLRKACSRPVERLRFIVDQPFMFMILHKPSATVLFEGKIYKPEI